MPALFGDDTHADGGVALERGPDGAADAPDHHELLATLGEHVERARQALAHGSQLVSVAIEQLAEARAEFEHAGLAAEAEHGQIGGGVEVEQRLRRSLQHGDVEAGVVAQAAGEAVVHGVAANARQR